MSEATKKAKISQPEALAPRAPFGKISRLEQDIERVFNDFWRRPFLNLWGPDHWWPARSLSLQMPVVDVYEEKDDVVVKAEVPGLLKEDLEVTLTESTLTLKGEKKKEEEIKEKNYYRSERSSGSFARSIDLPAEVKTDQAKASFKDGLLEIRLPKTDEAKKRTVKVKID
jgi:HSP20 family protein